MPEGSEAAPADHGVGRAAHFEAIEDPALLRRVLESTLLLEANLDLPELLHRIASAARTMTDARYAALGVLDDGHTGLTQFVTVGIDAEDIREIGALPTGKGVLGLLIRDPRPVRIARIDAHPHSAGFPPHHPPMTSFLGVPIKVRDDVYGNLYLTDKIGRAEFTADDQALVEALALTAAIAVENARLRARSQEVAVYEERDRLARDLHDTVIQRLFAVGLSLQSLAGTAPSPGVAAGLTNAIDDIDETIRQIRTSIFELESSEIERGVRSGILALVRELAPLVDFDIQLSFEGPIDTALPDPIAEHLLATIREALTNVGRHADATEARVVVQVLDGTCRLRVADDGRGIDEGAADSGGHGLANMRRRADKLRGECEIHPGDDGGTVVVWAVPLAT